MVNQKSLKNLIAQSPLSLVNRNSNHEINRVNNALIGKKKITGDGCNISKFHVRLYLVDLNSGNGNIYNELDLGDRDWNFTLQVKHYI